MKNGMWYGRMCMYCVTRALVYPSLTPLREQKRSICALALWWTLVEELLVRLKSVITVYRFSKSVQSFLTVSQVSGWMNSCSLEFNPLNNCFFYYPRRLVNSFTWLFDPSALFQTENNMPRSLIDLTSFARCTWISSCVVKIFICISLQHFVNYIFEQSVCYSQ